MRRSSVTIPLISLIVGAFGFFLRRMELNTVFDNTGLAVQNSPVSSVLCFLSIGFCLFAFIFAIVTGANYRARSAFVRAFNSSGFLFLAVNCIAGLSVIATSALLFREFSSGVITVLHILLMAFAFLSGISFIIMSISAYKGREGGAIGIFSVVPSLLCCVLLVYTYKQHISDPVLLNYSYQCLALSASALSFYYGAGFVYRHSATTNTVFSYMATVFFCGVVLADENALPYRIIFGAFLIVQLFNLGEFLKNLRHKN